MSDTELPFWTCSPLSEIPEAPYFGGIKLFSISDGKLLIIQQERGKHTRFRVYDLENKEVQELEPPISKAHQLLILSKTKVLFVKFQQETATHNAEIVLWNPTTGEQKRTLEKIPAGYKLCGDIAEDKLYLIATASDEGSAAGFDWKNSMAMAAIVDLKSLWFDVPFHEIEDLDVAMMRMLDAKICLVTAYNRRGDYYFHLRDMGIKDAQKDGVSRISEPSRYKLAFAGRDTDGGALFHGESYFKPENALFRVGIDKLEFTMVGHWPKFDGYYSANVQLSDGSALVFSGKRKSQHKVVRQYIRGQKAKDIALLQNIYSISDVVQGEDGQLYIYACNHDSKDGKWRLSRIERK